MDAEPEDAAAAAFEELRDEVAYLREAIERQPAGAIDYSPTLGRIELSLSHIEVMVDRFDMSPALRMTPDRYAFQMNQALTDAVRPIGGELGRAQSLTGQLERTLGAARTREGQRRAIIRAAGVGAVLGALALALTMTTAGRVLPRAAPAPPEAPFAAVPAARADQLN